GTYAAFGGRDASRGLATFQITSSVSDEYDDLSDLNSHEMESMREWEMQFKEKYYLVGRLLKPGEKPTNYSDEDEDTPTDGSDVRKRAAAAATAAKSADEPARAEAATSGSTSSSSSTGATASESQGDAAEADKAKSE
uniref:Cytochrome b5 heme-binding domain-containing protein n=1 Tax=Anopheles quadriannulatus TaxID=34691 RepID=A0A182XEK8_ANOQN